MPPQLEARRSERIDYRAEVELLARASAAAFPQSVVAHALDLGPGGMRLSTKAPMPIGSEVTCRMTLDGRPAAFSGRVAWSRAPHADEASNAHGMGICFESLGAYESALLRRTVERSSAGYRPVELQFTGIEQPVVARARAYRGGLRLSAALPIFARGTELSFQLDEQGPHLTGRIGDAALLEEHGARRIEIDVEIARDDLSAGDHSVRFRRRARYGYPDEIEAEEQQESEAARHPTSDRAHAGSELTTTRRQAPPSRSHALPMFVAALVGGTLAWTAASRFSDSPEQTASEAVFVARPLPLPSEAHITSEPDVSVTPAPPEPPVEEVEEQVATPAAVSLGAQPPSHVPRLPESVVEPGKTRIRIPFEGDLTDMRSTIWADPSALSIELPGATTSLEAGRYPIGEGGVTDLRVNSNARALLVRMRLSGPITRYSITAEDGVLEAQLHRARVSH